MTLVMWPFKRKAGRQFTQEERDRGNETKRLEAELRHERVKMEHQLLMLEKEKQKLEMQAEIEDLKAELNDDEEEEDSMLSALFARALTPQIGQPPAAVSSERPPIQTAAGLSLSDDQIKAIWEAQPPKVKMLGKMANQGQITAFLKDKLPNIDDDTCVRAYNVIKGLKSSI